MNGRLYKVTFVCQTVIFSPDGELDLRKSRDMRTVIESVGEAIDEERENILKDSDISVQEIQALNTLPKGWGGKCIPYCLSDGDEFTNMTIKEILKNHVKI